MAYCWSDGAAASGLRARYRHSSGATKIPGVRVVITNRSPDSVNAKPIVSVPPTTGSITVPSALMRKSVRGSRTGGFRYFPRIVPSPEPRPT